MISIIIFEIWTFLQFLFNCLLEFSASWSWWAAFFRWFKALILDFTRVTHKRWEPYLTVVVEAWAYGFTYQIPNLPWFIMWVMSVHASQCHPRKKKKNEGAYNILFLYGNNMTLFYSIKIRNLQHHHSKMNLSNLWEWELLSSSEPNATI